VEQVSRTIDKKVKAFTKSEGRRNGIRHFAWICYMVLAVGFDTAQGIAQAHEDSGKGGSKQDSKRDQSNNNYVLGYMHRHYDYIDNKIGRYTSGGDLDWLIKHGSSLYDRGYLWKLGPRGHVVHSP
jgi:hypothetical protein